MRLVAYPLLTTDIDVPRVMLDTQYRMHPAIAAFPSQTFYNGDLKNGTINTDGTPWSRLAPAESTYLRDVNGHLRNVMFINHEHEQSADHESLANFQDAEIVVQVVTDLLAQNPVSSGYKHIPRPQDPSHAQTVHLMCQVVLMPALGP